MQQASFQESGSIVHTMESNSSNKALIGIIVVVLLVAATTAAIVWSANNSTKETESSVSTTSPSPSSTADEESDVLSQYKSGSYSADGNYQTPGGRESIGVTVTLSDDGTITEATATPEGKTGESQEFQSKFVSGFKSQVVGKKIDEVSLSRVAGSSLTPNGFNNAIDDIQDQAKA